MIKKISKNSVAIILWLVALIGLDIPEQIVTDAVNGTIAIVAFGLMVWNQLGRKDIAKFFFRR